VPLREHIPCWRDGHVSGFTDLSLGFEHRLSDLKTSLSAESELAGGFQESPELHLKAQRAYTDHMAA
jgi:hypothetical protein